MTSPRTLLKIWNLHPKKQFGQNFLSEPSTSKMIISRSNISPDDIILEIGAGLGALTIPAAGVAKQVYALDKDHQLIALLKTELLAQNLLNIELMEQDILKFDFQAFVNKKNINQKLVVMGNLPYNISSQVLVQLIQSRKHVTRAVLMFQKELALRIMANPGVKDYGRITAMLKYCSDIKPLATIKAPMFFPKPKVDSEVVEICFKETPEYPADDEAFLFKVIKAAFGKRRKTLKNALSGSELAISADTSIKALEQAEIDPVRRAETLTIREFVNLSHTLSANILK
ncbi:Ribosomal RNA small subunit methyltransferase A [Desulfonema limicola]|uniref:Ribosomal RNA small subunit methyltransferase A n=1 Tax=Desulfonema limicola TaxID=45656 RepID=A0A975BEB2_9BACT|nr:16S rRNA (adenine(1518)-N(6)/adenine(1519)-N(6))-dimethyltransferase RsmA [Desulfonema limicola]QTA83748.1 Ribosomal RNA small subunit methyltransferase A [Desulfonema limicola]